MARQGFHVLAGVRRDRDADAIRSTGIEPVILEITHSEQVGALAARVARDSRALHALVNNAGVQVNAPLEALSMAQWRQAFEVNLFGRIAVTQALLPALLRSKGRVINISSIGGPEGSHARLLRLRTTWCSPCPPAVARRFSGDPRHPLTAPFPFPGVPWSP
ncbi:SDR family NAD(P)-dependent oxidoreductase [Streptomyces sp. NPDC020125]|uniref:SDR family NAD(P)-dependent oxidoreductase n=1 Tax=Streptomyces sp. NPDC020125 TaxID=3154593 RepID=UPI0033D8B3CE